MGRLVENNVFKGQLATCIRPCIRSTCELFSVNSKYYWWLNEQNPNSSLQSLVSS